MNITTSGTIFCTVHHIDNDEKTPNKVDILTDDLQTFTNKLFMQELSAVNKRGFKFSRDSSEIAQLITQVVNQVDDENFHNLFEAKTDLLAEKLLETQMKTAEKYPGIPSPKKGSLVTILQRADDEINILLSKIDQMIFLNLEDALYKAGLPEEKATQKTCSMSFTLCDDKYELSSITVSDTNDKISSFWYEGFLELKELNTDENNTTIAFNAIDHVLSSYVKRKSKSDHVELRNNLVGYFQTNTSFKVEDMIKHVIGEYVPESSEVKIDELTDRLKNLPNKKQFDSAFNIVASQIKARFKKTYKVTDKIELRTSDYIEDLKHTIIAKEDEEFGGKVLVIKNIDDELYETFKNKEE